MLSRALLCNELSTKVSFSYKHFSSIIKEMEHILLTLNSIVKYTVLLIYVATHRKSVTTMTHSDIETCADHLSHQRNIRNTIYFSIRPTNYPIHAIYMGVTLQINIKSFNNGL